MKDQLRFDTTDANTILDSDSVGAFVRANDGTLITKHTINVALKASLITQGIVLQSKLFGAVGNTYSFQVIDSGGSGPLSFTEVGGAIIVDLAGLTPTVAQVVSLLSTSTYVDASAGLPAGNVIVAGTINLSGGENTTAHKHLDVYAAMAAGDGVPITQTGGALNVNVTNGLTVDLNGIYNAGTNPTPDNAGTIMFSRAVTPGLADQIQTPTVGLIANIVAADLTKVHAQDVNSFLYAKNSVTGDVNLLTADNTNGGLNVNILNSTVTVSDAALANTAIAANKETLAVAGTPQVAVASPLSNRKYLWLYNMDNQKIFLGPSGVTDLTGFPVSPGSYLEMRAGASVPVYFVGSAGKTPEIRHLELS